MKNMRIFLFPGAPRDLLTFFGNKSLKELLELVEEVPSGLLRLVLLFGEKFGGDLSRGRSFVGDHLVYFVELIEVLKTNILPT